jgi:ornithine cyclodeaminase
LKIFDAAAVAANLPYDRLVAHLRRELGRPYHAPPRAHHDLGAGASMLLMPAWDASHVGLKVVNVFPGNADRGESPISSEYLLCDGRSGRIEALIDGKTLTGRRTAAVAAVAASFLAPEDADHLLLVGAGHIAGELPGAMAAVRPIRRVTIWARDPARAAVLTQEISAQGFDASVCLDLAQSVGAASIVACATFATEPLIRGAWLGPHAHLSLIGGYRPSMREADSEAIRRSFVVADTRSGVLAEAGDVRIPIDAGVISADHVRADLFELCREGRISLPARMPTLFKSVGHAVQDLVAATLCVAS